MRWLLLVAGYAILLALVEPTASAETDPHAILVVAKPLPFDRERPEERQLGALTYAGGLALTAPGTGGFGGLSGIDVQPDGRFISQSDIGDLLTGRIALDGDGRLTGLSDTAWTKLVDEQGQPFVGPKDKADAEDITYLPGGGYAVSFEQDHRVEAYVGPGPSRRLGVPAEAAGFPGNTGLEALTAWTDPQGRPRLVEGSEDGRAWSCDADGRDCEQILDPVRDGPDKDFSLTGLDALPDGGGMVAVYRAFDLLHGVRALVAWVRPEAAQKVTVLARITAPYTVDNMEGIAAVRNPDGSIRIYLISDDNLNRVQRTMLLAFDWKQSAVR
ncbi:MAG TPA: esterase-like activity of phytase family protein [Caulobacteraceae bacterium]|jgi:hypothetical protein|nr:esterase-like activity of phytase family protein [Caulobacteraceae bacterium]